MSPRSAPVSRSPLRRLLGGALLLSLLAAPALAPAARFAPRKAPPEGWDAKVELGAQATRGASRTSSLSGSTELSYRGGRWEQRISAKALQSVSSVAVPRRDENGDAVLSPDGEPISDIQRDRTNDRRFLGIQPRWFFREQKNYLFAIADYESNEPADIRSSTRQIAGVGYRLWRDKSNYFTAGIGVGNKRLERVTGEVDSGGIGYVGLNFVRLIAERARFEAGLDSDFGGESRHTELALGLSWTFADPVALKFGYEARVNSDISNPSNPFDESVDARATISLEIDVL